VPCAVEQQRPSEQADRYSLIPLGSQFRTCTVSTRNSNAITASAIRKTRGVVHLRPVLQAASFYERHMASQIQSTCAHRKTRPQVVPMFFFLQINVTTFLTSHLLLFGAAYSKRRVLRSLPIAESNACG
jgi:hypothetical protein